MTESDYQKAQAIVASSQHMVLSTSDTEMNPWVVPIELNWGSSRFHWLSDSGSRHSRHVAENGQVAFMVGDIAVPHGHGEVLYGRAKVRRIESDEGEWKKYTAEITELWLKTSEKIDGEYKSRTQLDPRKLSSGG